MGIKWHVIANEGYPQRSGFKIVTLEYVGGERCIAHRMYDAEKRGFYDGEIHYPNVIAWAEMPEPYRG